MVYEVHTNILMSELSLDSCTILVIQPQPSVWSLDLTQTCFKFSSGTDGWLPLENISHSVVPNAQISDVVVLRELFVKQ